jgi:hypothetical protein
VFALGLTLLTGCALNKGTAMAADFDEDWAGTPDVVKIHTTDDNTLPFAGYASGTLTVEDGTSADRVTELAGELREYVTGHDNVTGRIVADGVPFTVSADEGLTGEVLALWRSLTADDRVTDADIDTRGRNDDSWHIKIATVDATGAMAVFKDMVAEGDRHRPLSPATSLEVRTEGLHVETDYDGSVPAAAIAAYEAVLAQYPVVGARLTPDRAGIVVAESADLDDAGALARSAAPSLGAAVEVTSDSGN